jgi:gas vesicle protein
MSNRNHVISPLTGAAIGAGVGILFAPDKGSKQEERLKTGIKTLKRFSEKYEKLSDEVKLECLRQKIDFEGSYDDLLDSMSHKTEDVILFLEDKLSELKLKTLSFKIDFSLIVIN